MASELGWLCSIGPVKADSRLEDFNWCVLSNQAEKQAEQLQWHRLQITIFLHD